MTERINISEVVTRERAIALGLAANEIGGITIKALRNEGEEYVHFTSPIQLRKHNRTVLPEKITRSVVPEGRVYIETSGVFPPTGTSELHQRADELESKLLGTPLSEAA